MEHSDSQSRSRKPGWFVRPIVDGRGAAVRRALDHDRLHTVCIEAGCPNRGECFARGTATFLILGDRCTRDCRYCGVAHGAPGPPDPGEPARVAAMTGRFRCRHVVITSVTRDDLPDGGAAWFARTVEAVRREAPDTTVEILIPDFRGNRRAAERVLSAGPVVIGHNLETVPRLFPHLRPEGEYRRSLDLLAGMRHAGPVTKSGLMLGLGETGDDIATALEDLRRAGVSLLTLGQYLQPNPRCAPVARYLHPDEFDRWAETAGAMGFDGVAAGPLVRSSYRAEELYRAAVSAPVPGVAGIPAVD